MSKANVWCLALILGMSCPAHALADKLDECLDSANTQRAMEHCARDALKEAEGNLGILYNGHLINLEREQKEAANPEGAKGSERTRQFLKESQDAWVKYRSSNCDLHAAKVWEGTMATLARQLCYVRMTKDRIQDITRAFEPR
jgi:uncharacterized protein YecT (DUF1311 family)